jgi:hypothetical protein
MKLRIIAVAMGLSLALSAARGNDILAITETGENFNDLIITLNGAPVSGFQITGVADNWLITLPSGWLVPQGNVTLGEPESSTTGNLIPLAITQIGWQSETPQGAGSPTTVTIPGAGQEPSGAFFDLRLTDSSGPVSDAGSTITLLGSALTGLGLIRRFLPL